MRKLGLIALLPLIACNRQQPGPPGPAAAAPSVKLSYLDPRCDPSAEDCRCTGAVDDPEGLKALGIGPEELKSGVVCLLGDFDGNGSRDVAIAGRSYDCERSRGAPVRVILTDHERILRSLTLPEEVGCISPSPLTRGVYPGVTSDRDGLDATVTADGTEKIYYWDGTGFSAERAEEGD